MNKQWLYYLTFFFLIIEIHMYSQVKYSELALTGRGNLELTETNKKLQPDVYNAFLKMQAAALKDGISIEIVSAYRSFEEQKVIWNRKYNRYISRGISPVAAMKKIIKYSTLPGTSRHHWGTDVDIIDASAKTPINYLVEKNFSKNGVYEKMKNWMDINAEKFGFYLVYTNNLNRKGFKYEPWHYSYKAYSVNCLSYFLKIDLLKLMHTLDINGSNYLTTEFLKKYLKENICDINPKLK